MANKNKAKGTRAETKVVRYLRDHGFPDAKRKALSGNKDKGDIQAEDSLTLEVKAGHQTANYNRTQLEEWLRQSEVEGCNCGHSCFLVIVRYNKSIEDAEVWWKDPPYRKMMYLSEFVKLKE